MFKTAQPGKTITTPIRVDNLPLTEYSRLIDGKEGQDTIAAGVWLQTINRKV